MDGVPKDNMVNLPENEEDKQRYIEELRKLVVGVIKRDKHPLGVIEY